MMLDIFEPDTVFRPRAQTAHASGRTRASLLVAERETCLEGGYRGSADLSIQMSGTLSTDSDGFGRKLRCFGNYCAGRQFIIEILIEKLYEAGNANANLKRKFLTMEDQDCLKKLSESDKTLLEKAEFFYNKREFKASLQTLEAIRNKNESVCCMLAALYENNFRLYDKAEAYYLIAAEKGHVGAMNNLAVLYKNQFKLYDKAAKYYLMAFRKGYTGAMFNLARLYQNELKLYDKAKACYTKAVEKGHTGAMLNLALLCHKKFKSYREAEKYYLMAVEKGHIKAMLNLALLYHNVFSDYGEAEKYYLMAIGEGDANATLKLASLYHRELKSYKDAEKYYLMAVKNGHVTAMLNLALLYEENEFQSYDKAEKYYLMAAEKGQVDAMFNLALLHHRELGHYENAEKYYLMAVEKGHADAMFNLALLYEDDEFKSYENAEKYYLMAAERGIHEAMNNLAWLYFVQKKKKVKALEYSQKACEKVKNLTHQHTLSAILLWNNQVERAVRLFSEIVKNRDGLEEYKEDVRYFLLLLIAKKQHRIAMDFFQNESLPFMEKYKPIYYILMSLMGDEYSHELREMGEDMKQGTMYGILQAIEQLGKDYR